MASKEVPQLPAAAALDGTEEIHIVQGGNSRKLTLAELIGELVAASPTLPTLLRLVTLQVLTTTPIANEILAVYPVVDQFTIPANLAGSNVAVLTNPAAAFTITIARYHAAAWSTIGSIVIATDGTVTLATTGGTAKVMQIGDVLKFTADSDGDATFIGAATLYGTL